MKVMHIDLENYLIQKYPDLYTDTTDKSTPSFQFECGDGWFRLILWLSGYLQDYIKLQNEHSKLYPDKYLPIKQIKVRQVKEKFATLRFYCEGGNEHTSAVIQFAEYISGYICEISGVTDNIIVTQKEWLKTKNIKFHNPNVNFIYVDDEPLRKLIAKLNQEKSTQLMLDL